MKKIIYILLLTPFCILAQNPNNDSTYLDCTSYVDTIEICKNSIVNFKEFSYSNNFEPLEWRWWFQGANPDTSTKQNPDSIRYETPGFFNVKCSTVFLTRVPMFFRTSRINCMMVRVLEWDIFDEIPINDTNICNGNEITLNANINKFNDDDPTLPSSKINYLWTSRDGSISFVETDTLKIKQPGFYKVRVFTSCGSIEKEVEVKINYCEPSHFIPNAFTPNGDGLNDTYNIYIETYNNFLLKIYNRWGEIIFESSNPSNGWDGSYKGEVCENGIYTSFIIINNKNYITNLHLLR